MSRGLNRTGRSLSMVWLWLCLGLFAHGFWVGIQSDLNILDHRTRAHNEQVVALDDHHHAHGDAHVTGDSDNPLDVHHHHHFSETTASLVPSTADTFAPLGMRAVRVLPGDMPAPDGVRPSGPFQPPRA
ncbi:hypothetical protein PQU92_13240 [Asticcacaulis sp. BYS171W]|uniref:Cobalt transporter n=1 Tax=Asticcacaulis aquaticus TaxID=2984212 RepID=A0ABT5HW99_9CAUL|nr:hypothetical protein [Asticcacaulis aquaticus]MDC7684249.1 hypothetical protein [Asticcacaulis aquaticus]